MVLIADIPVGLGKVECKVFFSFSVKCAYLSASTRQHCCDNPWLVAFSSVCTMITLNLECNPFEFWLLILLKYCMHFSKGPTTNTSESVNKNVYRVVKRGAVRWHGV